MLTVSTHPNSNTCGRSSPLHSRLRSACGHTLAEAPRHRRSHQASCRHQNSPHHLGDVHRNRQSCRGQLHSLRTLGVHTQTAVGDRSRSSLAGDRNRTALDVRTPGDRNQTLPDVRTPGDRNQTLPDDHIRPGSLRRTCAPDRSLQRRETGHSLQSGAWETGSCSSCACVPARQNLNDACQHRHPSLRRHYHVSSYYASSLLSRASCVLSSGAFRTNPRRLNRRRPNRLSWICGTYRVA